MKMFEKMFGWWFGAKPQPVPRIMRNVHYAIKDGTESINSVKFHYIMDGFEYSRPKNDIEKWKFNSVFWNDGNWIRLRRIYKEARTGHFANVMSLYYRTRLVHELVQNMHKVKIKFPEYDDWLRYLRSLILLDEAIQSKSMMVAFLTVMADKYDREINTNVWDIKDINSKTLTSKENVSTPSLVWEWYWMDIIKPELEPDTILYRFKANGVKQLMVFLADDPHAKTKCVTALKKVVWIMNKKPQVIISQHEDPLCVAAIKALCGYKLVKIPDRKPRFELHIVDSASMHSISVDSERKGLYIGHA